ncbi:hypothetical protein E2C01_020147 [Portunus trituberculatus]|uniref:Uncharacterized protein n=1 Tax=Portunus trituberculatus TaxID=210409 RepID=A0A5B7E1C1_PORTR|nr:hypothetical protein [Portunus trituberculatus]
MRLHLMQVKIVFVVKLERRTEDKGTHTLTPITSTVTTAPSHHYYTTTTTLIIMTHHNYSYCIIRLHHLHAIHHHHNYPNHYHQYHITNPNTTTTTPTATTTTSTTHVVGRLRHRGTGGSMGLRDCVKPAALLDSPHCWPSHTPEPLLETVARVWALVRE